MTQLQELIVYVRQRTAMEFNFAVTNEELTTIINGALGELYGLLVTRYEDYFLDNYMAGINTNGNTAVIPLPPNLMKIRAVDYNQTYDNPESLWYTINQFSMPERNQFNNPMTTITQPWGKVSLAWRMTQGAILITPQNQAQGIYRVWFVPQFPKLVNLTDTVPSNMNQQGWLELPVAISCIRVCNKMRFDSSMFEQEKIELVNRIKSEAKNRQAAGGKRIANVRFNNSDMMMPMGGFSE